MISDFRQRTVENESKSGEKRPAMYLVIANSHLEFLDKDHAHLVAAPQNPSRVAGAGCLNRQWLIKTRDVAPTD